LNDKELRRVRKRDSPEIIKTLLAESLAEDSAQTCMQKSITLAQCQ
jgi:hypothetical protein